MGRWVEQIHPERQGDSGGNPVSLRESGWDIISGVVDSCPKNMVSPGRKTIVSRLTRAQEARNVSQILRKLSPVGALVSQKTYLDLTSVLSVGHLPCLPEMRL